MSDDEIFDAEHEAAVLAQRRAEAEALSNQTVEDSANQSAADSTKAVARPYSLFGGDYGLSCIDIALRMLIALILS